MLQFLKGWIGKKPVVPEKPDVYPIVCPYCFSKFGPEEVVFRATHHVEGDPDYALQEDEELNRYRARFHLSPIDEMEAVLHPASIPEEKRLYAGKVLVGLNDRHGRVTRKRLCPQCHNELPITAGKVPSNIISIVGASQVGKSVYMTSLIRTLQHATASHFHAACMPLNADISRRFRQHYEEPIFGRGMMLDSTQKEEKQEPFIFQFVFKDETLAPITLVFFDVAGEIMTDRDRLELYAAHIQNSSGILFMVDPLQIRTIRDRLLLNAGSEAGEFAGRYDEPRDVAITLFEHFIGHEQGAKTSIPTAVVLTKSDMLQHLQEEDGDYIRPNSNVFRNVVHREYLNLSEFGNMNGEISRFLEKVDRPFKDTLDVYFTDTAYFAVSALGANPVDKRITGVVTPWRVDEPFVWLLYRLGYIDGRAGS